MNWSSGKSKDESRSIFVTGVVQQAAGAGTIRTPQEIDFWVSEAVRAFNKHINGISVEKSSPAPWILKQIESCNSMETLETFKLKIKELATDYCTEDELEQIKTKITQRRRDIS